ncbi:MAG: hypothetical protein AAFV95_25870 [Bacteroidota bacterium]
MKNKLIFSFLFLLCGSLFTQAQDRYFLEAYDAFSRNKTSYFTLVDGTQLEGKIRKIKRKKWLFQSIKIKDATGKTHRLTPKDIRYMHLPPASWDVLEKTADRIQDITRLLPPDRNSELLRRGYVYFEQVDAMIKNEKKTVLLQLLNPTACSKVRVYHDPSAMQRSGLGVRDIELTGAYDNAFYFKKEGQSTAIRVKRKKYRQLFAELYDNCPAVNPSSRDVSWRDLEAHVFQFDRNCEG